MRYTAIPHRHYRHGSGRIASIYGAAPYTAATVAQWEVVQSGFTWSDAKTGTIGLGRAPVATLQEARAIADSLNAAWDIATAAHAAQWAPINAPITWTKRDGRHHSGEGWSIRPGAGGWYQCEDASGDSDLPAFRTLAKAKTWCNGAIRNARKNEVFK